MKLLVFVCAFLLFTGVAVGQQQADPEFNTSVENPAYKREGPRARVVEAHNNFHSTEGRYKPFVDLMLSDGYRVIRNRQSFSKQRLESYKLLVIANALGAEEDDDAGADESAFNADEITAVYDWVKDGGALLLIADHAPFGGAASALANKFGVDMSKGYTFDPENSVADLPSQLIFSRENKLLASHPITEGRNEKERVNLVRSFTGQSLKGPEGSTGILNLSNPATDRRAYSAETSTSAAGRTQAVGVKFGK